MLNAALFTYMHFTEKVAVKLVKKIITKHNVDANHANQFAIIDNLAASTNPFSCTNYILSASSEYSTYQIFNKKKN